MSPVVAGALVASLVGAKEFDVSLTESGTSGIAAAWDRYAVAYQNAAKLPTDVVTYGVGVGTEAEFRLLGPVAGKRVVDLGCGGGQNSIAFARQGAISIGVDVSVEQLAYARRLLEQEEVRVEFKHSDLSELAFQRADSVDIVFSAMAFQYVPDLPRAFRQVHRVLKPQGTLVFSVPHPASAITGNAHSVLGASNANAQLSLEGEPASIRRSYFDSSPLEDKYDDTVFTEYHRTMSEMFMGLTRTGYRVDVMMEPAPKDNSMLPKALIVRARKEA